jgi:hypothetical protein
MKCQYCAEFRRDPKTSSGRRNRDRLLEIWRTPGRAARVPSFLGALKIDGQECPSAPRRKPDLIVDRGNLPATAEQLRDLFAQSGRFFDRGIPVKIVNVVGGGPTALQFTPIVTVIEAHKICRPVKMSKTGAVPETLPERVAHMYLAMKGDWSLPPLVGISTPPLLASDGTVRTADGYDPSTGLWCASVPTVGGLPERPTRAEAEAALMTLRHAFRTFPFADAPRQQDTGLGVEVVDLEDPPGLDESAFLVALLTAICRARERGCWCVLSPRSRTASSRPPSPKAVIVGNWMIG